MAKRRRRRQRGDGSIVEKHSAFHLRYWILDDSGNRVQRSVKLCDKDNIRFSTTCQPVRDLAAEKMRELRVQGTQPTLDTKALITDFWEQTYVPFIEENKKPSTVNGYKQIWNQHLKAHFTGKTLYEYK